MKKWLLADLHIHSTFSDGSIPVEEIVKIYGEAGFDVIAITDHLFDTQSPRSLEIHEEGKSIKNVEVYFQKIEEVSHWAKQAFGLLVIPGLEICTLSEDYHILKDSGIGICEEDLEKIFEPFYRGKNVSFEKGVGLGLSLVKEVVDIHEGKILVQSEPNKGSTFSILLPIRMKSNYESNVYSMSLTRISH